MAVDALDTRILGLLIEQPRTSVREYARILSIAGAPSRPGSTGWSATV